MPFFRSFVVATVVLQFIATAICHQLQEVQFTSLTITK
jgi:hypothetical protein